jgi:SSS family transporter
VLDIGGQNYKLPANIPNPNRRMRLIDLIVIVVYLIAVAVFGIVVAGRQRTTSDYFLGSHRIPWWAVCFSIVATETSTLTFISIPSVAYFGDFTFMQITFGYLLGRILVSWIFLPAYFRGELATAYQFLERRFGAGMRNAASVTFMFTRLLADGVRLFATAIPLAVILRSAGFLATWPDWKIYTLSIVAISTATVAYTYIGGIRAVVTMDAVQMTIYLGGALAAGVVILAKVPEGFTTVLSQAAAAGKLQMIEMGSGLSFTAFLRQPYTLLTAILGGAVFTMASHGTDQLIVQRLLATNDLRSSQRALVSSGVIVMVQFFVFLSIGLLLWFYYRGAGFSDLGLSNRDEIFPKFIVEVLPAGLSGLIIAGLLAAAMSTLSSSLNSLASATTLDLYKPYFGKNNTPARDLLVSRLITLGWAVILTASAGVFVYLQVHQPNPAARPAVVELGLGIASYTYGGLLGAFLLGVFLKKPDQRAAAVGFFSGLIAMLFLVKGPVQRILPGEGISLAWPLYTVAGSAIVITVGWGTSLLIGTKEESASGRSE